MYSAPLQVVGTNRGGDTVRRYPCASWGRSMQDAGCELPRTPLLGTWVNKGKKMKGRGPLLAPGMKTDGASFMLLLTDPAA